MLVGRIGKKDSKALNDGNTVTRLSLATTEKWKDSTGTKKEKVTWHTINFFGKLSDIATRYAHVGDLILVEGKIDIRKYEDKEGLDKYVFSITASDLRLLPNKSSDKKEKAEKIDQIDNFDDSEIPF